MQTSWRALLAGIAAASAVSPVLAQEAPAAGAGQRAEAVVVTGTRVADRSALDTAVAVDVVDVQQLTSMGTTELNQALSVAVPSFNFPRPAITDGTDTVRPASLRGLAPDQTLVLVNSKRRHAAALVNVNGSVGRGSAAADLNTIPTAAIGGIEVLRDGASAQYGSDAIAGVINIRLKEESSGGGVSLTYGQRMTTVKHPPLAPRDASFNVVANAPWNVSRFNELDRTDGVTYNLSGWAGFDLFGKGFLTVSAEFLDADRTIRSGPDWRQQFPLVNGQFDPREAGIDRFNHWAGDPKVEQVTLFANAGYDLDNGVELYGWLGYQNRDSLSAGFFRRPLQTTQIDLSIYPLGFLPKINPEVNDYSGGAGATWEQGAWTLDASVVFGYNEMQFTIRDTLNASFGPDSKRVFDSGGFNYDQLTFNFSGVRTYEVGLASPLNVAVGVEARRESYELIAGEPDSYRRGTQAPTRVPGAQVFPGFQPSNQVDEDRSSVSAYVDLEANITEKFLASVAVRAESYSDFGETVTGKLAARYDFTDSFALRGSVQNGFRAPSLQQQFFTATSTNFINNVPVEVGTFPSTSRVGAALGGLPLEAETSVNFSLGSVIRVGRFGVTIDAYQINMENRIVLSENLQGAAVVNLLTQAGVSGVTSARFFINGVDTETRGIDIVTNWRWNTDAIGDFAFTLGANFNETEVTKLPATRQLATISPSPVLFARVNELIFEKGQPKSKITGSVDWTYGRFGATARAIHYGEVLSPGTTAALDQTLSAKTVVDLEGRVELMEGLRLSVGADNVFDEYPDLNILANNASPAGFYSNLSPFGRSGRYVYARISYGW